LTGIAHENSNFDKVVLGFKKSLGQDTPIN